MLTKQNCTMNDKTKNKQKDGEVRPFDALVRWPTVVHNMKCEDAMPAFPDNFFDLAIVDPPYGIGKNWNKDTASKFYQHRSSYDNQTIPDGNYFAELFRISKNQIIWGANYYWRFLPETSNIIWWDKMIDPKKHLRSSGELAWTSITKFPAHQFTFSWNGCATSEPRSGIHPHEKPITLYRWLIQNYGEDAETILDTHLGSGSSRIASDMEGKKFIGFEMDTDYYNSQEKRFEEYKRQLRLFEKAT